MYLKHLLSRQTINGLSRFNGRILSPYSYVYKISSAFSTPISRSIYSSGGYGPTFHNLTYSKLDPSLNRYIHSIPETKLNSSSTDPELESDASEDATMNEFLSRFVWIMRGKLMEVYPECNKQTMDGMLLILVQKVVSEMEKGGLEQMLDAAVATPSQDFSEDLWKTVWEVSNLVLNDMKKARNKEKMKTFLQSEEVKEMSRFAGEIGIRGDMLRELRFKWAREKMEESEFYENLERLREEAQPKEGEEAQAKGVEAVGNEEVVVDDSVGDEKKEMVVSLPKRHGKIRYKIYGLDLSNPKWTEVADKVHEREEIVWPQEPKPISGKCKIVTENILTMKEEDDPSPLLDEWAELLQPRRIDWISLLDRLKENTHLYLKVAELVLSKESFQTNTLDYTKLIDVHAKENRLEDVERILKKMNENGISPDILTSTVLVHMYCKAGNLESANVALEGLRSQGVKPDMKIYSSMIMAYVNAGKPEKGKSLMEEMEMRDIKPTKEIYMALLQAYAECGHIDEAKLISRTMDFAGFPPSLESSTLLVKACEQGGDANQARKIFDNMIIEAGYRPDDRCTSSLIAAYEKKNMLDKALDLLLQLEKDGFEPGVATYNVLVVWLANLQLVDEAEQLLGKIAELGEAPSLGVHISLCDMYARTRAEKKALQALGVVEANKEQLKREDFERIIKGLIDGGFSQDAQRIQDLMASRGFSASYDLQITLASKFAGRQKPTSGRRSLR